MQGIATRKQHTDQHPNRNITVLLGSTAVRKKGRSVFLSCDTKIP